MSKKSRAASRSRRCHQCGRNGNGDTLERHHVFGGAYRMKSERYGAVVDLCGRRCHRESPEAVHRNAAANMALKEEFQRRIMAQQGWDVTKFVEEFGKNYT